MQNNMKKTQSQLIKNTEELKIKTRRRLIGSVIILLIASFILFKIINKNDTHKTNIEIKIIANKESNLNNINTIQTNSKNINDQSNESKKIESNNLNINSESLIKVDKQIVDTNITNEHIKTNDNQENKPHNKHSLNPKIVIDIENSNNPDDILNNINVNTKKIYVQFIALDSKEKILLEKNYLQSLGIKTFLKQVKIKNKIFYRLRSNSFNSKEQALKYLNDVNNKLG